MKRKSEEEQGPYEEILRVTRRLEGTMERFGRNAREYLESLESLTEAEVEEMVSPRANLMGILESLLADHLDPTLRKLRKVASLMEQESMAR